MRIDPPTPDAANEDASKQTAAYKALLMVCTGTQCAAQRAYSIRDVLRRELTARELERNFLVMGTGCIGFCDQGPLIVVQPEGIFYQQLKKRDIPRIVETHLIGGKPVDDLIAHNYSTPVTDKQLTVSQAFSKQRLIALRNTGLIDPERIESYLERGGYNALALALGRMKPDDVLEEVMQSGLHGRNLTTAVSIGDKWETCIVSSTQTGTQPVVVCSADEDGTYEFVDRSIIENDPHTVIEGMCLGAYALGAKKGVITIKGDYPGTTVRLEEALDEARQGGHLGQQILGTNFSFDISIRDSLTDEETGLDEPTLREQQMVINNVESWANIPVVVGKGGKWYGHIGTGRFSKNFQKASSNSKVIALEGKARNTGLMEVSTDITLKEVVDNVGGGIPGDRIFKAAQLGGPSGNLLPASFLDKPLDFDMVIPASSSMEIGAITVFDNHTCMVDIARHAVEASKDESCGKCVPCREGTMALGEILNLICLGEGRHEDLINLKKIAKLMEVGSACQVGSGAARPVLSTLQYFIDEYSAHIDSLKCIGGVCKQLITYTITDQCTGCMICRKRCPSHAVSGEKKQVHVIDQSACIKCGLCLDDCKFDAVHVE
ncbi:MAG: NADH-quinone oxidoreductase subunit F [Proteobacteria bacterium]|nr:NADH-quinone oxidoreductase subunit F [Pseudomonadota bacterium]